MQDNPGTHLALGQIRIDIDTQIGTPENDPWEGTYAGDTSPWEDTDNNGIPDIFKEPATDGGTDTGGGTTVAELSITTTLLPDPFIGVPYTTTLAATGQSKFHKARKAYRAHRKI